MGSPYIGEIRMFAGNFAPAGWAFCNGQLLPISENDALFVLIGTTYGGDGQETFALPNLQGRFPIHAGQGPGISQHYQQGEMAGVEAVTLTSQQTPAHTHPGGATQLPGTLSTGEGGVFAASALNAYTASAPNVAMKSNLVGTTGGSQPHDNLPPYLCISFIISLYGIFPSQN